MNCVYFEYEGGIRDSTPRHFTLSTKQLVVADEFYARALECAECGDVMPDADHESGQFCDDCEAL